MQQSVFPTHDGRSTTATDVSSNVPATSTPDSHGTSNTSYKGSEVREEVEGDEDSNASFYWHSGRSSSEGDNDHIATIDSQGTLDGKSGHESASTARVGSVATTTESRGSRTTSKRLQSSSRERKPSANTTPNLPLRSSSLSPNPAVSYTASVLGGIGQYLFRRSGSPPVTFVGTKHGLRQCAVPSRLLLEQDANLVLKRQNCFAEDYSACSNVILIFCLSLSSVTDSSFFYRRTI